MIIEGKESAGMRETWVDYAKGIGIILVVFGALLNKSNFC